MSKIAVVTDTNSGITREEAKKLGVYLLPIDVYKRQRISPAPPRGMSKSRYSVMPMCSTLDAREVSCTS